MGSCCHGKNGSDCILKIPPGTVIYNRESGEFVGELLQHGEQMTLLRGGRGGVGNVHFKSSTNQAPRHTVPGTPGEEGIFRLEMKSIAHIGLVGLPNAGKSTLTNLLTATKRKTGPYPFTTLHPKVGTMIFSESNGAITIADIPGLIDGAHRNRGLGCRFLRHIERCAVIAFMIDLSPCDGRSPVEDFRTLHSELAHYNESLLQRNCLIIGNKTDIPGSEDCLAALQKGVGNYAIFPISCQTGEGIAALTDYFVQMSGKNFKAAQGVE
jgi:GTP-binding protein